MFTRPRPNGFETMKRHGVWKEKGCLRTLEAAKSLDFGFKVSKAIAAHCCRPSGYLMLRCGFRIAAIHESSSFFRPIGLSADKFALIHRPIELPVQWVLTVTGFGKYRQLPFMPPNLLPRAFWIAHKFGVALRKVPIYRSFCVISGAVVAIVNYSTCHSTKNRFNHVQKLCSTWQRRCNNLWKPIRMPFVVMAFDMRMKHLRYVPRRGVPR